MKTKTIAAFIAALATLGACALLLPSRSSAQSNSDINGIIQTGKSLRSR